MAASPIAVTVELATDGACVVSVDGARVDSPAQADVARCALPARQLAGKPIVLRVILPEGAGPSDDAFPRLGWYREGDRVIGTATLPATPAFVSLHRGGAAAADAAFGWNFFGFFVFAAAFIAIYFAWAAWTARRDRARAAA